MDSSTGGTPQPRNNRTIIIVAVAVILLCCCCLIAAAGWACGDTIVALSNGNIFPPSCGF